MSVATLSPTVRPSQRRRTNPLREPGTDYPRLGGLNSMGDILSRLAERLPAATSAAFPEPAEDDKLKAS